MNKPLDWTEFWQDRWQKGMIGFHQSEVEALLQKHAPHLPAELSVFVPLCGKSKDMIFFAEKGHAVIGVELSALACEAFFKENHLVFTTHVLNDFILYQGEQIKIYCGDFFKFRPEFLPNLGLVYDRAALIALPKELRKPYSEYLIRLIHTPKAQTEAGLLIVAIAYDQALKNGPPFSVTAEEIHMLYHEHFKIKCLESEPDHLGDLEIKESAYWLRSTV